MPRSLLWTCALLLFVTCRSDDDLPTPRDLFEQHHLQLHNLRVGQQNHYAFYIGEDYADPANPTSVRTGDTLRVEIVSEDSRGFYVRESLTAGSFSHTAEVPPVAHPDEPVYYYLAPRADGTRVELRPAGVRYRSRLFFLEEAGGLPLRPFESPEVAWFGWKTDLPGGTFYLEALLRGFTANESIQFRELNILVDNSQITPDGGVGTMHWYDPTGGALVRTAQYSGQTKRGFGWDLLW